MPATVIRDAAGLAALASELRAAGRFGVAVLTEGGEADPGRARRPGLRAARRRPPLRHRSASACWASRRRCASTRRWRRWGRCWPIPAIAKSIHDGKFLEVMLSMRGHHLAGVAGDTLLAAYLLDASRTRYDLDVLAGGGRAAADRRARDLAGQRPQRPRAGRDPRRGGRRPRWPPRPPPPLALAGLQQNALAGAGTGAAVPRHGAAAGRGAGAGRVARHPHRPRTTCASWARSWRAASPALEQEIHRLAGTTFNIGSPKQLGEVLFGKLGLPVIRRTKTGPSTDADVLEELASLHEVPAQDRRVPRR